MIKLVSATPNHSTVSIMLGGEFLGDVVKMQMIHCYDHRGEPIKFADLSDDYQSLVKDNLPSEW